MEQNYLKGRITVVFPADQKHPLYGKILPNGCDPRDQSKQLNFNVYALKENKLFPEESGECEIDYKDSTHWTQKENNGSIFYVPVIPFEVLYKEAFRKDKNGNTKKVAVAIRKNKKNNYSLNDLEAFASGYRPKDNSIKTKKKVNLEDPDLDDEASLLEAAYQQEIAAENAAYTAPKYEYKFLEAEEENEAAEEVEEENEFCDGSYNKEKFRPKKHFDDERRKQR